LKKSFASLPLIAFAFTACGKQHISFPPPGALQAGVAEVNIPAPVGIGTAGFGPFQAPESPSPFASIYPGTTRVHGHPSFKAVVLSRGAGNEVIFVRSDTVGVFQQLRHAVAQEVQKRTGRSIDDALIMGGTHTHSGPGRILEEGMVLELLADKFLPEFYQNFIDAAATAVVNAYADLRPAEVGSVVGMSKDGHYDRRCEDLRDYTNDKMPIIAIKRDGQIDAVVLAYAMHGTVLGIGDLTLSEDASGSIERHVEASFDHPVTALFFNSWGADMGPGMPSLMVPAAAPQPANYDRLLEIGNLVAGSVQTALAGVTYDNTPVLYSEIHRVPINREAIGYDKNTFPYEWGGAFCNAPADQVHCDVLTTIPDLDKDCIAFPQDEPAPMQTEIGAGQVGALRFLTFPGEPTTLLIEKLTGELSADFKSDNVMLFGYALDYIGYSLLEDDWYHGGYEASGSIWGPKQGQYLLDRAHEVFKAVVVDGRGGGRLSDEPDPLQPFVVPSFTPYAATMPQNLGMTVKDVATTYAATDVITLTVRGSDPWLGTPVATLQDATGKPILLKNGRPVTSDGYAFWVDLIPTPSYKDQPTATSRAFEWTFSMPASVVVDGVLPKLSGGSYRLEVVLPTASGTQTVDSSIFMVN
jgi:hypothetical protein